MQGARESVSRWWRSRDDTQRPDPSFLLHALELLSIDLCTAVSCCPSNPLPDAPTGRDQVGRLPLHRWGGHARPRHGRPARQSVRPVLDRAATGSHRGAEEGRAGALPSITRVVEQGWLCCVSSSNRAQEADRRDETVMAGLAQTRAGSDSGPLCVRQHSIACGLPYGTRSEHLASSPPFSCGLWLITWRAGGRS